MNEPLEGLEAELKRWQPLAPGPGLEGRIAAELDAPQAAAHGVVRLRPWFWWAPVGLAAALAVMALVWLPRHQESSPATRPASGKQSTAAPGPANRSPSGYRPVRSADYLLDAQDDGIVYTSATTPFRKIKYHVLSTSQWRDEADNATVQVIVPRQSTVLIPMNVY
jgi:hypothetical protein